MSIDLGNWPLLSCVLSDSYRYWPAIPLHEAHSHHRHSAVTCTWAATGSNGQQRAATGSIGWGSAMVRWNMKSDRPTRQSLNRWYTMIYHTVLHVVIETLGRSWCCYVFFGPFWTLLVWLFVISFYTWWTRVEFSSAPEGESVDLVLPIRQMYSIVTVLYI